jgi:tetratricopeptide (TPR) repeat protein
MMPAMRTRMTNLVGVVLTIAVAGCGDLTCSQSRKDAIKHHNAGVEALKTKSYTVAQKEFETAVNLDPEFHYAAYSLGEAYMGLKDYNKAAESYGKAIKYNDREAMYHYKLAKAYLEAEKVDLARGELEKALKLNARLFKAHFFLGNVDAMQDRPKEAAQEWTESARLDPGFGKPFYSLGKLYYRWGFYEQAISVLEQGGQHARDPEDKTNIFYQLGLSYHAQKQVDKAIEAYDQAIKSKADNVEARLMLGNAYADKGDKAQAKLHLDEFIKLGGGGNPFNIQSAHERLLRMAADL